MDKKHRYTTKKKKIICTVFFLFLFFEFYIFIRIYWIVSCVIPTYSMSPTLIEGDYVFVSLQIPGRRILDKDIKYSNRWLVHRKKGIRPICKNDIVVFNYPYSEDSRQMIMSSKTFFCKRCVAIPGDSYQWYSNDVLRKIYVPKKGDVISIDSINYKDYYKCIEYETGMQTKIDKIGNIYIADTILTQYHFLHDYYFMCGDYSSDSYDSRFWGILPDDFILGVGKVIWFSKDPKTNKIRWERMFRSISN